ncbi:MAG TPA: glucosyl-3-phosphoglycerate synthase [Nocardioidaceae bacterium]
MSAHPSPRPPQRWSDWTVEDLVDAKEARGLSVSLVLPARDEAATVGGIVARVRESMVEAARLVDEIVVIDSDSSDATAEVARTAGATVHPASSVRPDLGVRRGKGEAMWKSLFVTSGDVLVFMDADLTEWDTHFVSGLLGPLLTDDGVALVKGFYDRPMAADPVRARDEIPSEGGRVTELVARPLLALHWPGLAHVVQPLAGEWAVRRELFEQLRVPSGYAVELGVLVDAYERLGPRAVAQVDLGLRKHGHQGLRDLGVMALQIQAMVESRIGRRPIPEDLVLRQYDWSTGSAVPVDRAVDLRERPPAVDVPGYPARRREVSPC